MGYSNYMFPWSFTVDNGAFCFLCLSQEFPSSVYAVSWALSNIFADLLLFYWGAQHLIGRKWGRKQPKATLTNPQNSLHPQDRVFKNCLLGALKIWIELSYCRYFHENDRWRRRNLPGLKTHNRSSPVIPRGNTQQASSIQSHMDALLREGHRTETQSVYGHVERNFSCAALFCVPDKKKRTRNV